MRHTTGGKLGNIRRDVIIVIFSAIVFYFLIDQSWNLQHSEVKLKPEVTNGDSLTHHTVFGQILPSMAL